MPTYVQLGKTITTGVTSSLSFNSIPQTYTDLIIRISSRNNAQQSNGNAACTLRFNNNANSLYGWIPFVYSAGGSAFSVNLNYTDFQGYHNSVGSGNTANLYSNAEYYIPGYTLTGAGKTFVTNSAYPSALTRSENSYYNGAPFRINDAISSIQITPTYGSFIAGCIFILYGVGA